MREALLQQRLPPPRNNTCNNTRNSTRNSTQNVCIRVPGCARGQEEVHPPGCVVSSPV
jgi:hypothetical protein